MEPVQRQQSDDRTTPVPQVSGRGLSINITARTIWYAVGTVIALAIAWALISRALSALLIIFIAITIGAATATRPWSFIVGIAARSSCTKTATPRESAAATESRATLKELPPRAGALFLFCAEPSV